MPQSSEYNCIFICISTHTCTYTHVFLFFSATADDTETGTYADVCAEDVCAEPKDDLPPGFKEQEEWEKTTAFFDKMLLSLPRTLRLQLESLR
jgi:hypothetical protein